MSRLVVDNLCFSHHLQPVLRDVGFQHSAGQILTLLGPSGSGKTTLLWLLAGLLAPDRGQTRFETPDGRRPTIGFVFQDGGLWDHLRVRTHLDLVLRGRGLSRSERRGQAAQVMEDVGLTDLAERYPVQLSGGQRQRLAVARALVIRPEWLFLDEPTSQLDGPSRQELIDLLDRQLRQRPAGVILATHQVDLALRLSDQLAVLLDGQIAQIATPEEVFHRPTNLAVARLLGPAFAIEGDADNGILARGGVVVLHGLPLHLTGPQRLVLRPRDVTFERDPSGNATVRRAHYIGQGWELDLDVDGADGVVAFSAAPVAQGTKGRILMR